MSGALAVCGVSLRRQIRDRRLILVATVLPVALIFATGSVNGHVRIPIGVVSSAHNATNTELMESLKATSSLSVHVETSPKSLNDDILRGIVVAGLLVPSNFGTENLLEVTYEAESDQSEAIYAHTAVAGTLDVLAIERQAPKRTHVTTLALARARHLAPTPTSPFSYVAAGDLVLFAGVTLLVMSAGIVESRKLGISRRILASPISVSAVIVGQLLSLLVAAVGQGAALIVLGRIVFGVHWGNLLAIGAVVILLGAALAGISVLIGTAARSHEQAVALGVIMAVAGGMLGGSFWSLGVVGPLMRDLGHLTPQAWAIDAFVSLIFGHAGLSGVVVDLGVLAVFAGGLCALAARRLRRDLDLGRA